MDSVNVVFYSGGMERIHVDLDKPWLSVADICEYMDVSTFVVTSVLRTGELPAVKFGREWRVSREDFENWINDQRSEPRSPKSDLQSAEG
jgi:excisionase family DNA binding protein